MKIVLLKASKFGKAGDYVEVPHPEWHTLVAEGIARHPTVGEIRKAEGLESCEQLVEAHAAGVKSAAEFAAKVKARGNKFEPLKLEEIQQRNARAARGLAPA